MGFNEFIPYLVGIEWIILAMVILFAVLGNLDIARKLRWGSYLAMGPMMILVFGMYIFNHDKTKHGIPAYIWCIICILAIGGIWIHVAYDIDRVVNKKHSVLMKSWLGILYCALFFIILLSFTIYNNVIESELQQMTPEEFQEIATKYYQQESELIPRRSPIMRPRRTRYRSPTRDISSVRSPIKPLRFPQVALL